MDIADEIFAHKIIDKEKLLQYGFIENDGYALYNCLIADGEFILRVKYHNEKISSALDETATNEPYSLYNIAEAEGAFVGELREEARKVLADIADKCAHDGIFVQSQTLALIDYAAQKYGDKAEFPWDKLAGNAVIRRADNSLWYAVILTIKKEKLWHDSEGIIEIADVRALPKDIDSLADGKTYFRGYHMNKTHWLTVPLDGSVADEELFRLLDDSHALAVKGKTKG